MAAPLLLRLVFALAGVCASPQLPAAEDPKQTKETFAVEHSLRVTDIPPGSENVRIWFWIPDDDEAQKVLDLAVTEAPAGFQITHDPTYGSTYLCGEIKNPGASARISTRFTFARHEIGGGIDPLKAGPLTESQRATFAEHLRCDCPNMEVSNRIVDLADEICATETNVVKQARLIYDYVIDHSNHYSLPSAPKSSGKGSALYCLDIGGGGCTDQHALFIALARARGIPTRLQFGTRLPAKNEGKELDPGYRCWVQYFVPNYGWISCDVSAGDTTPAERERFATGLDCRRIHFAEGRDLQLNPPQTGPRINLLIGAYVEVDGKPHTTFERRMKFERITARP